VPNICGMPVTTSLHDMLAILQPANFLKWSECNFKVFSNIELIVQKYIMSSIWNCKRKNSVSFDSSANKSQNRWWRQNQHVYHIREKHDLIIFFFEHFFFVQTDNCVLMEKRFYFCWTRQNLETKIIKKFSYREKQHGKISLIGFTSKLFVI
jgi:hypothetical protein